MWCFFRPFTAIVTARSAVCIVDSLTKFLVEEKGFNPERVARGIEKLKKARGGFLYSGGVKSACTRPRLRSGADAGVVYPSVSVQAVARRSEWTASFLPCRCGTIHALATAVVHFTLFGDARGGTDVVLLRSSTAGWRWRTGQVTGGSGGAEEEGSDDNAQGRRGDEEAQEVTATTP